MAAAEPSCSGNQHEDWQSAHTPTSAISSDMPAHASRRIARRSACACFSTRSDGLVLGLTSSKVGFDYSGVSYLPDSAIAASAARQTTDTSADNAEVDGILQSDATIETEVRGGVAGIGKYQLFLVNYDDLSMGSVIVSAGRLGVVTLNDGSFKFELLSWRNLLKQNVHVSYFADVQSAGARRLSVQGKFVGPRPFGHCIRSF